MASCDDINTCVLHRLNLDTLNIKKIIKILSFYFDKLKITIRKKFFVLPFTKSFHFTKRQAFLLIGTIRN